MAEVELKSIRADLAKLEGQQSHLHEERNEILQARAKAELVLKDLNDRVQSDSQQREAAKTDMKEINSRVRKAEAKLTELRVRPSS